MFPHTPHCELAVLFERVEAEVPEKVEPLKPDVIAETIEDAVPDAEMEIDEVV